MSRPQQKLSWGESWGDEAFDFPDYFAEPPLARRRRLKEKAKQEKGRVQEVDRSGSVVHLERAAKRLRHASAADRVLRVPQWDMEKAVAAMKLAGVAGQVSNLCGSQLLRVNPKTR